jgi:hypothetical protein
MLHNDAFINLFYLTGGVFELPNSPISSRGDKYMMQRKCVAIFVLHINY